MSADPQDQITIANNEFRTGSPVNIPSEEHAGEPTGYNPSFPFIDPAASDIVDKRGESGVNYLNQPIVADPPISPVNTDPQSQQVTGGEEGRIKEIIRNIEELTKASQGIAPQRPLGAPAPATIGQRVNTFPETNSALPRPQTQFSGHAGIFRERLAKKEQVR